MYTFGQGKMSNVNKKNNDSKINDTYTNKANIIHILEHVDEESINMMRPKLDEEPTMPLMTKGVN